MAARASPLIVVLGLLVGPLGSARAQAPTWEPPDLLVVVWASAADVDVYRERTRVFVQLLGAVWASDRTIALVPAGGPSIEEDNVEEALRLLDRRTFRLPEDPDGRFSVFHPHYFHGREPEGRGTYWLERIPARASEPESGGILAVAARGSRRPDEEGPASPRRVADTTVVELRPIGGATSRFADHYEQVFDIDPAELRGTAVALRGCELAAAASPRLCRELPRGAPECFEKLPHPLDARAIVTRTVIVADRGEQRYVQESSLGVNEEEGCVIGYVDWAMPVGLDAFVVSGDRGPHLLGIRVSEELDRLLELEVVRVEATADGEPLQPLHESGSNEVLFVLSHLEPGRHALVATLWSPRPWHEPVTQRWDIVTARARDLGERIAGQAFDCVAGPWTVATSQGSVRTVQRAGETCVYVPW